jgi:hypothetical protein
MKPGRMVIAAALLAALGIALWWSNRQEKAKEGQPAPGAPPHILAIGPDTVKQIEIQRRGEAPTVVTFNDKGKWEITQPKPLPADALAVASITSAASKLDSQRVVDPNVTDPATYGLAPALVSVAITTKDGKTSKLLIGETTPTNDAVYAKLDGDPRLFTMATSNKSAFDKDANDLRDKHLLSFNQDQLSGIELTAKKQTFDFAKAGESGWQIVKPKVMRADGSQVEDLISKLRSASMDLSVPEDQAKKAAAAFGSAPVVAIAQVTDPTGTKTLEIKKIKDDYYAKSSGLDGVYKVSKDLADGLDKPLEDFRNKKIFDFGFSDPSRIEVKDGAKDSIFDKGGDKWMSGGKVMDSTSVQAFIDKLRDLSATKFVDTGFTTPVVTLIVVSDQGKRRETAEISQAASGGNFIARREGDTSLYELDANTVKDLRQAVGDVREAQSAKK